VDFLGIVQNNNFLNKLFPEGLSEKIGLIRLNIGPDNKASFCLEVTKKPSIEVKKWGEWGKDYNVILLYFYGEISDIMVDRFGLFRGCNLKVSGSDGLYTTIFYGENVHVEIEFKDIFYEKGIPVFYDDYQQEIA